MSKERYNQIIEEVYENYKTVHKHAIRTEGNRNKLAMESLEKQLIYTQKEFINKIKTDTEFSEKWKLTIEERELTLEERHKLALPIWKEKYGPLANMMVPTNVDNTPYKIPTKLITTTYNDKTIENYE